MELPRVLQVQQFTAAREPELRGLWDSLKEIGRLDGSKLLPRQLRRRATSHRRYICKRRPNARLAKLRQQQQQQQQEQQTPAAATAQDFDEHMQDAATAAAGSPGALPAAAAAAAAAPQQSVVKLLNRRQRRRPALLQQQAIDSCAQDLAAAAAAVGGVQSAAPRRLESHMWHARRMRMGERFGHTVALGAVGRGRGSRALLHTAMCTNKTTNPKSRFYRTQDSSNNTGHSAAAAGPVRAVCHDASYWCCLELQGQQQQLLQLLTVMSDPVQLQQQLACQEVLSGQCEVQIVLHMPGKFPAGTLGPACMLWHSQLPSQRRRQQQQQQQRQLWLWCHASYFQQVHDILQGLVSQSAQQTQASAAGDVTAAAAAETAGDANRTAGFNCAAAAAGFQGHISLGSVRVQSLCSSLRRVELVGPSADYIITSVIKQQQQQHGSGSSSGSTGRVKSNDVWTAVADTSRAAVHQLPEGCVLGLSALDPRLAKPLKHEGAFMAPGSSNSIVAPSTAAADPCAAAAAAAQGSAAAAAAAAAAGKVLHNLVSAWPQNGKRWLPASHPLLRNPAKISPAAPEILVSSWRQQQQQAALGIGLHWQQQQQQRQDDHSTAAAAAGARCQQIVPCSLQGLQISPYGITSKIQNAIATPQQQQQQQQQQLINAPNTPPPPAAAGGTTVELALTCPLLLVRRQWHAAAAAAVTPGWSLLLPAGWVGPFWEALTYAGAKAAGQHEWGWLAAAHQTPLAPLDYPDSPAAAAAVCELHNEIAAAAARRPLGRWGSSGNNMVDHAMLPFIDWSKIGQKLLVGKKTAAAAAAAGSGVSRSSSSSNCYPHAAVCWAAADQLQSAARSAKQQQRKRRQQLRKQQRQQQQQQQEHQQEQQQQHTGSNEPQQRHVPAAAGPNIQTADNKTQQQQQQQRAFMLPLGWYVARSWRTLIDAVHAATAQGQLTHTTPAAAAAAAAAVPPAAAAAARAKSKAVQKAVDQGVLQWQPKGNTTPPEVQPAVATAAAAAAATQRGSEAMDVDFSGPSEHAAAAAAASGGSATQQQQRQQQQQQRQQGTGTATVLVGAAVKVIGKGRCQQGALIVTEPAPPVATAAAATPEAQGVNLQEQLHTAAPGSSSEGVVTLLGYVTSAVPRGAPAGLYPGGLGFCSVHGLWQLRCRDATAGSSRVLRVWVLNPGSTVLRKAELRLLLDN